MNDQEKDRLFGEIGADLGFLTQADVAQALEAQKVDEAIGARKPIGAYLLEAGKLNRDQIGKIVVIQGKLIARAQPQAFQPSSPQPQYQQVAPARPSPPANLHASQHPSYGSFTALGLLIWPLGLLVGFAFLFKSDPLEHKLGEHTLVMSILSGIFLTPLLQHLLK